MNIKELKAIAKVMDECGIVFLKTNEIELHKHKIILPTMEKEKFHVEPAKPIPFEEPYVPEEKIEHKNIELSSVMKLSDTELVDRLFPEDPGAPLIESEAV